MLQVFSGAGALCLPTSSAVADYVGRRPKLCEVGIAVQTRPELENYPGAEFKLRAVVRLSAIAERRRESGYIVMQFLS